MIWKEIPNEVIQTGTREADRLYPITEKEIALKNTSMSLPPTNLQYVCLTAKLLKPTFTEVTIHREFANWLESQMPQLARTNSKLGFEVKKYLDSLREFRTDRLS